MKFFHRNKKQEQSATGSVLHENYVPAYLPRYGEGLDDFIPSSFTASEPNFIQEQLELYGQKMEALISNGTDEFTAGRFADSYLDTQLPILESQMEKEAAVRSRQARNITNARAVRVSTLQTRLEGCNRAVEDRVGELRGRADQLRREIEPLQGIHATHVVNLFGRTLSLGTLVTVAAMLVDAWLNFGFLQNILTTSVFLLCVAVVGMSILSDCSMACVGGLLSYRKEDQNFMPAKLYKVSIIVLTALFVISVVASVCIRFGSLDQTYGTMDLDTGEFIGKESYTVAEYAIAAVTSFLTTATGVLSLVFSVDYNQPKAARRKKLQAELEEVERELEKVQAEGENKRIAIQEELDAICGATDPFRLMEEDYQAAHRNIDSLALALKGHIRKLFAEHSANAAMTEEKFTDSCDELLSGAGSAGAEAVREEKTAVMPG